MDTTVDNKESEAVERTATETKLNMKEEEPPTAVDLKLLALEERLTTGFDRKLSAMEERLDARSESYFVMMGDLIKQEIARAVGSAARPMTSTIASEKAQALRDDSETIQQLRDQLQAIDLEIQHLKNPLHNPPSVQQPLAQTSPQRPSLEDTGALTELQQNQREKQQKDDDGAGAIAESEQDAVTKALLKQRTTAEVKVSEQCRDQQTVVADVHITQGPEVVLSSTPTGAEIEKNAGQQMAERDGGTQSPNTTEEGAVLVTVVFSASELQKETIAAEASVHREAAAQGLPQSPVESADAIQSCLTGDGMIDDVSLFLARGFILVLSSKVWDPGGRCSHRRCYRGGGACDNVAPKVVQYSGSYANGVV